MIELPTLTTPAPRARPPPSPPPLAFESAVLLVIVTLLRNSVLEASPDQKIAPPLPSAELETNVEFRIVAEPPLPELANAPPSFTAVFAVNRLPLIVVTALVVATLTPPPGLAAPVAWLPVNSQSAIVSDVPDPESKKIPPPCVSRPLRMVRPETEKLPALTSNTRQVAVPEVTAASTLVVDAPAPVITRLFGVVSLTVS